MRKYLLLLLLICSVPAFAAEREPPRYLDPELISPELLVPPAKEKTKAWDIEILMTSIEQKRASERDKEAMKVEQKASVEMVTTRLQDGFDAARYPKTFELLHHAFNDTAVVTDNAKKFWGIKRPYQIDPKQVKLLVDPITNPAYPSGHTSISYVLAEILGILVPDKRAELRQRAISIAKHRIQAGVHSPQDIEGGKRLGAIVLGAMLQNSDFQKDLAAAKEELKNFGK